MEDARVEGEKARDWAWYSVGIGLLVYTILFLVYLLTAKDGAVRKVDFDWQYLTSADMWRALWKGFQLNLQGVRQVGGDRVRLGAGRGHRPAAARPRSAPRSASSPRRTATCSAPCRRCSVITIVGFGLPKADPPLLGGHSDEFYAVLALSLVYGAYVSEVYRAGIESIHWSQTAAARSLGLTYGQTMRLVVVPQAVRRVTLPLMNDMVALQKDTSLIFILGGLDVINTARFYNNAHATFTAYTGAAILFAADQPAARPGCSTSTPRRDQRRRSGGDLTMAFLELIDVHKHFGTNHVLRGIDLGVEQHEVVCLIGASGCGKSTMLRCINALETIDSGRIDARRLPHLRARRRRRRAARPASASSSRASTCSRT